MITTKHGHTVEITPQPIQRIQDGFMYQLDAPLKEGGINIWSGNLQANNGYGQSHVIKAAKLFAAAEELLAVAKQLVAAETEQDFDRATWCAQAAIAKAEQE